MVVNNGGLVRLVSKDKELLQNKAKVIIFKRLGSMSVYHTRERISEVKLLIFSGVDI